MDWQERLDKEQRMIIFYAEVVQIKQLSRKGGREDGRQTYSLETI